MIIDCINCAKKFEVNADLIPIDGRTIQCGSCNHLWFFKKDYQNIDELTEDPKVEPPAPNLIDKNNNNDSEISLEINKPSNDDKIERFIAYSYDKNDTTLSLGMVEDRYNYGKLGAVKFNISMRF